MVVIDRAYAGGAVKTVVSGTMTPTVPGAGGTFTVGDATGWPSSGKMAVKLNAGLSDEEHVVVDSRSGNVFTVGQRGADGTNAQAHDNPTCELYWDARSAQLITDHVDDVEVDPHSTKLLNNTRHDITARHTYGAALGTRPVPASIGTANAAGSGANPSAGDHVHAIGTAAINAAAMFAAGVVDAAAIGAGAVGSSEIATDAVGADEIAAGAVGTSELADLGITLAKLSAALLASSIFVPIGGILAWGTGTPPSNYLTLNGQAVSRTTYSALFALWSTTFGAGDGVTTFNVMDIRQRVILGQAASGTGAGIGDTGGSIDHVHSLDTATAIAKVESLASGSTSPYLQRKTGVPSWTANISTNPGANANAASQAFTSGAGLQGSTDSDNMPFIALPYIVRAL